MARFVVDQPIRTREPTIVVDAGLAPGRHRFRLEVVDSAGRRSAPDVAVVTIERRTTPGVPPSDTPRPPAGTQPVIEAPAPAGVVKPPRPRKPKRSKPK